MHFAESSRNGTEQRRHGGHVLCTDASYVHLSGGFGRRRFRVSDIQYRQLARQANSAERLRMRRLQEQSAIRRSCHEILLRSLRDRLLLAETR